MITNSNNIRVTNCSFINCYGVGIAIEFSNNLEITNKFVVCVGCAENLRSLTRRGRARRPTHSTFSNLNGGVYALGSQTIAVRYNFFENVAKKGKQNGSRGQFVQVCGKKKQKTKILSVCDLLDDLWFFECSSTKSLARAMTCHSIQASIGRRGPIRKTCCRRSAVTALRRVRCGSRTTVFKAVVRRLLAVAW